MKTTPRCGYCGQLHGTLHSDTNEPIKLKLCYGCQRTFYCGTACQRAARKNHKATCSPRVIRVPEEDYIELTPSLVSNGKERELEEQNRVRQLVQIIIEQKIRPEIIREDAVEDMIVWFREMLLGPALPFNKEKNFIEDILKDSDFIADSEIFLESLSVCHSGLIERNRKDDTKRSMYPDPSSAIRFNEEILRRRCNAMVLDYSKQKDITDVTRQQKAIEDFYTFYKKTILDDRPKAYNSYTGLSACMGDMKFMKKSEDIVLVGLGLKMSTETESHNDITPLTKAPPPVHTLIVFIAVMMICLLTLPSVQSINEVAKVEAFTTPIFEKGLFHFPPLALAIIRFGFASVCACVSLAKSMEGVVLKLKYLPGSKLREGIVNLRGIKTQGTFTAWSWNFLGISFFLCGLIPFLLVCNREDMLYAHPWILRLALISFEIAAPLALFVSFVVTYILWPNAFKTSGPYGTERFKGWINLFQHNANTFMVLLEVCLMGRIPVRFSHVTFVLLYTGVYQIFLWYMANRWDQAHGPLFLYFFNDTTLGKRTTIFMLALLFMMVLFYLLFLVFEMSLSFLEKSNHGCLPNCCLLFLISSFLMKYND